MFLARSMRILTLLLSLAIVGCDNSNNSDDTTDAKKKVNLDDAEIILSEAGIGPINAETPFNIHHITEAFREYRYHVEQVQTRAYSNGYPVMRVSKNTDHLLLINPDIKQEKIFSILVQDKRVGNSLGHPLGMQFGAVYEYGSIEKCVSGTKDIAGKVLCYAPNSGNVLYMFGDESSKNFPVGQMPPMDALDSWELKAIIWKPKK